MPPVYAIISFLSYRFFRDYTYYSLIEVAYEAVTLSAFMMLLIEYVATTAAGHAAENAIARKDKTPLPFPFCFWRYRPTKAYFMYTIKWSVLQYVVVRPGVSIAGIVCEYYGVLCPSGPYSIYYAEVYLEAIDFVSITVALYGLFIFYGLTHAELQGRRPLAKFLAIKLIVMFTFYQSFVFSALESHGIIKATDYWTSTNIANGLNALAICIEMVFFAAFMMWAYTWKEYTLKGGEHTSIWRPLWDSINYTDFAIEIFGSLKFYIDYLRGKPGTHGVRNVDANGAPKATFGEAFGVDAAPRYPLSSKSASTPHPTRRSDDEGIRLAPYNPTAGSTVNVNHPEGARYYQEDNSSAASLGRPSDVDYRSRPGGWNPA